MKKILFLSLALMGFCSFGFANNISTESQIVCQQSDYDYLMNKIIKLKADILKITSRAEVPGYYTSIKMLKEEIERCIEKNTLTQAQRSNIQNEFNNAIEMLKEKNVD